MRWIDAADNATRRQEAMNERRAARLAPDGRAPLVTRPARGVTAPAPAAPKPVDRDQGDR